MNPKKIFDFIGKKNPKYELENILNKKLERAFLKPRLIQYNPHLIKFIDNPSEELQLMAVGKDTHLIQYIDNQSEEVQLRAVEKDPRSIEYIKNPSEEVQLRAVEKDIYSIEYIKNPSEEIQLKIIDVNPSLIQFINNPSEEVQLKVVDIDGLFVQIKNPTDKVKNYYRKVLNDDLEYYKELLIRKPENTIYKQRLEKRMEQLKKLDEN